MAPPCTTIIGMNSNSLAPPSALELEEALLKALIEYAKDHVIHTFEGAETAVKYVSRNPPLIWHPTLPILVRCKIVSIHTRYMFFREWLKIPGVEHDKDFITYVTPLYDAHRTEETPLQRHFRTDGFRNVKLMHELFDVIKMHALPDFVIGTIFPPFNIFDSSGSSYL